MFGRISETTIRKTLTYNKCGYTDCGHEWLPRHKQNSPVCPACHRQGWKEGRLPIPRASGPRIRHARIIDPSKPRGSEILAKLREQATPDGN